HFSDGDNLTSDNARCVKLVEELMKKCNMFGYGEVNQFNTLSCVQLEKACKYRLFYILK
ncbi:DUF444 family protein, partial [Bacillus paranthracis]